MIKNSLLARCICFPRNFPQPIFSQLNAVAAFCKGTGVFLLCQLTRDEMQGHARTQAARDYSPLSKPAPNSLRQPVFHSARVPELLWRDLREAICRSQRSKVRAAASPRASPAPCCRKAAGTLQEGWDRRTRGCSFQSHGLPAGWWLLGSGFVLAWRWEHRAGTR